MDNQWENSVLIEIEFYHKFNEFKQDLEDLLKENAMQVQFPTAKYEDGNIFYGCPTPEEQVIYRMEREECLKKSLIRGYERVNRLRSALEQLDCDAGDILHYLEIEPDCYSPEQLIQVYGLKNMDELLELRQEGLRKVKEIYQDPRKMREIFEEWDQRIRREVEE